jgi:primary-amine oxidase
MTAVHSDHSGQQQAQRPTLAQVTHPLQRLSANELWSAKVILSRAGLLPESARVASLGLEEPPKDAVLAFRPGDPIERRVRAVLLDLATGQSAVVLVSLTEQEVESVTAIDPAVDGQPPIILDEFIAVDEIVKADPGWVAAMARRGITDVDLVRPCPLSAGHFALPGEEGHRLLRVLSFLANRPEDHCWSHPIDGVVAYVDLTARKVVQLLDHELLPVPSEEANHDDPAYVGPTRTTMRPIEITQPDGPSFAVDGDAVEWEGWRFRVGFDPREGLVLHQLSINDRPLIYRASIAEMVVPYADPSPVRYWQNYFDAGEYLLGQQANSLVLGCDCLGEIYYFDAVLADSAGDPREITNAICMHEEDFGVLWKHSDLFTESAETRRQRRLVVSFWATIGNYDYGFFWYLYLDGTIEMQVKATGTIFTSSYVDNSPWSSEVSPGLAGPYHQHLFSARLDMMLDGLSNAVDELDIARQSVGPDNPYGNAFTRTATRLRTEADGARTADASAGRVWRIVNPERRNRVGRPVGYLLKSESAPALLADPTSSIARRAAFATKHLWVTRYDPAERYPAGDLVNQHPGGAGLPMWTAQQRDIDGQDIVLWHTFGTTHFPRTEDWPVMPVETCGFTLKPSGFFDRNPTLDVPASVSRHCAAASAEPSDGGCH